MSDFLTNSNSSCSCKKKFQKNVEKFQKSLSNMDKSLCMYTEVFALIKRMRSGFVGILKVPRGQLRSCPTWLSNKQQILIYTKTDISHKRARLTAAHILKLERYREDQHGPCARMTRKFVKRSKFFFLCGRDILNKLYELHCRFLLQITKYHFQGITSLNRRLNGCNNS